MNKTLLTAIIAATLFASCKKEVKKLTAKELHYDCVKPYEEEYGYYLYYKGSLQVKTTADLSIGGYNDNYILYVHPLGRDDFRIDINCDNGTCFDVEYPSVVGKVYGLDSLSLENGDYKTVLISHKL